MILAIAILPMYLFFMFFSPSTLVASENMDMLNTEMNPPDLIEQAGIEAVKQVMGKNMTDERIGEIWGKCRNCALPDYETWQKNNTGGLERWLRG